MLPHVGHAVGGTCWWGCRAFLMGRPFHAACMTPTALEIAEETSDLPVANLHGYMLINSSQGSTCVVPQSSPSNAYDSASDESKISSIPASVF